MKVADRIEKSVLSVLSGGFRTKDIMSPGCEEVKCSDMGELLLEELHTAIPA